MTTDDASKRVVIGNANGPARIAILDLSQPNQATVEQQLTLSVGPLSPITSLRIDAEARYAYATLGTCDERGGVAFAAIRLVPSLTEVWKFSFSDLSSCCLFALAILYCINIFFL
jgi:hypothetical protein